MNLWCLYSQKIDTMKPAKHSNRLYPVFLKMGKLNMLIVGGGSIAFEKLSFLLNSSPDAKVTLVAPDIDNRIHELAAKHTSVKLKIKTFSNNDLKKKQVVLAATNDKDLNRLVWESAKNKGILVNVTDTPALCDFYLGSIVTKGDLKIGISTNGKSPTFAKRFREVLEKSLPDELPQVLENLFNIRSKLKVDFADKVKILNNITENLIKKNIKTNLFKTNY